MRDYLAIEYGQWCKAIASLFLALLTISAWAQEKDQLAHLREQFIRYQENALQEKVFVHTSKDNLFSGETIFFKLYTVDGMLHQPLDLNTVAFVELINSNKQPVIQCKVALNKGNGNGFLVIPDSLSTGRYKIIAYTSWMKNFNADYFFAKDITIINPMKKVSQPKNVSEGKPALRFFPEGGYLVEGLMSKVAFQVTSPTGQGLNGIGVVLDERGDTVATFLPLKFGIGNFMFTPEKGKSYKAYFNTTSGTAVQELSTPHADGHVMTIATGMENKELNIRIQSNRLDAAGSEAYLFVHNRQRIRKLIAFVLDDSGQKKITIPIQELEDGISHVTLFDQTLKPLAERLFFKQPRQLLNINIDGIKPSYAKRELVSVAITTQMPDNQSVPTNLSLSVFKVDGLQSYDSTNIVTHLLLTSDLRGNIENPFYYLNPAGDEKIQAIDNLMLTHGWSRFTWQDVMNNNWPVAQFGPDHEGMTIRARVTNDQDAPVANANVFLSAQAADNQFYAARSNPRGLLQFYTRNLYGKGEIMLQPVGNNEKFSVTLLSPFSENYPSKPFNSFTLSRTQVDLIRSYNIHRQVQRIFSTNPIVSITPDSIPFFGIPDKSYILSDYVTFPQVKDVLKEYVPEVIVRKSESKFQLFVLDRITQNFFTNEPFVLLDGVPVFDTDRIITMPGNQIKRLDLVNRRFFYGLFVFNGIVSLTSDSSRYGGVQMNPEAMVFDFEGLQLHQEFYSPVYPAKSTEERLPDFRNVLIWAPEIMTDEKGKATLIFSTSDLPGQYIGVMNGLTHGGSPGSVTFKINVK